jgi:hypothetical protein
MRCTPAVIAWAKTEDEELPLIRHWRNVISPVSTSTGVPLEGNELGSISTPALGAPPLAKVVAVPASSLKAVEREIAIVEYDAAGLDHGQAEPGVELGDDVADDNILARDERAADEVRRRIEAQAVRGVVVEVKVLDRTRELDSIETPCE